MEEKEIPFWRVDETRIEVNESEVASRERLPLNEFFHSGKNF
jgi:hypothetical protein